MTGHEPLLALRRKGYVPAAVWVDDTDSALVWSAARDWHVQPNPYSGSLYAEIVLRADDMPETMDFRCLVGLRVFAGSARSEERAARLFEAVKAANPAVVVSTLNGETQVHWRA